MPTDDLPRCPQCGAYTSGNPMIPHYCAHPVDPQYGRYTFTPNPLTADDIRKIVREEIERAGLRRGL